MTGALAVAIVAAAAAVYVWQKNQNEVQANEAMFAAAPSAGQKTTAAEDYAKIAEEHPNTSAAERAELLAAAALFGRGDSIKAQALFQKFADEHPNSEFLAQAAYGIAACIEAQKKTDQAIAEYEKVARAYPMHNVASQAKLAIGRLYESENQFEKALNSYSELEKSTTALDMWKSEAVDRREKLLAHHPELRKEVASKVVKSTPEEQIIEVTTPPEGSTEPAKVKVLTNTPAKP